MRITKKKRKLCFFIALALLVLALCLYINKEGFENFYDENNKKIDIEKIEKEEQEQAQEYIKDFDCVLELGARYGTVSEIINKKLKNPLNHVVVEPDCDVWESLEKNKKNSGSQFQIIKGFISNKKLSLKKGGYGTNQIADESSTIPHFTFNQVKAMVTMPFTALVADCEGCIEDFLKENTEILNTVRIILLEEDFPDKCNYGAVKKLFNDFSLYEAKPGFHSVWIRS